MGRRHAKQTKATVGDLQKVSSNESTAKREINWKWMLSLSQQNGPGQQQQHLFVTTNKTNTPKQICKLTHLHMEKPPFAADSLMLMPSWRCVGGGSCGCQINIQIQHIKIFFFYFLCKLLPVFHLHT